MFLYANSKFLWHTIYTISAKKLLNHELDACCWQACIHWIDILPKLATPIPGIRCQNRSYSGSFLASYDRLSSRIPGTLGSVESPVWNLCGWGNLYRLPKIPAAIEVNPASSFVGHQADDVRRAHIVIVLWLDSWCYSCQYEYHVLRQWHNATR